MQMENKFNLEPCYADSLLIQRIWIVLYVHYSERINLVSVYANLISNCNYRQWYFY